ncbi:alpha/beta hydrolase [Massilibacteroides sp.]|uniref:alpha/beta fold hydrolase n=1 Tax=Massilibacteroides sp. TaxID=2034766 RepID=UPI00261EF0C6|nr:alpha/beta hydrolase [Massilibacteroides sp.]MDD4515718.1 alpha/beta hydrolase [Massilibacteroides sp.]
MKQLFTTNSGKQIAYRTYGHADCFPVILHHGLVGSCDLLPYWDIKAKEAGINLIAIERPGYGDSDPDENMHQVIDWSERISPLLDSLNIKTFGSIGISAGTPYAYSLAAGFPDKVERVWILSGVPFLMDKEVFACYPKVEQQEYTYYKTAPLEAIANKFKDYLDKLYNTYDETSIMRKGVEATMKHNRLGIAREAKLQITDWGFKLEQIVQPTTLWHSVTDDIIPFTAVQKTLPHLPNATLNIQKENSHFPSEATVLAMFREIKEFLR